MKLILIILVVSFGAIVESEVSGKVLRRVAYKNHAKQAPPCTDGQNVPCDQNVPGPDGHDEPSDSDGNVPDKPDDDNDDGDHGNDNPHDGDHGHNKPSKGCLDCKDPCTCLPDIKPANYSIVKAQEISQKLVYICTPGSHFNRIEYDGSFNWNTSCNAVLGGCTGPWKGFYTGIRNLRNGKQESHSLDARDYCSWTTFNTGNAMNWERTPLSNGHCKSDVFTSISDWVADDPITGCCTKGVNHLNAVSGMIKIYGKKCCSQCTLQSGSVTYPEKITNTD